MSAALLTRSLLVELFVEELPPKALKKLGDAFALGLAGSLRAQGLAGEHSVVTGYASPRRLAAHVSAVPAMGPDQEIVTKLMPCSVALDKQGRPSEALRKRLAKEGREKLADLWPDAFDGLDGLFMQSDGKVEAVYLRRLAKGTMLRVGLQKALEDAIAGLPIPKLMTYQLADGWSNVQFVRPAHGLVALHGPDVVPVSALGLEAGRETRGHRFEASFDPVVLQHADHYAQQLLDQGAVIASFAQRRGEIARQLQHAAAKAGLVAIDDPALLDEVTALVERPNVLLGRFDEDFLEVPAECLVLTMKANQKYFPLLDARRGLTNRFLIVSNIRPEDPGSVIGGNERVVRPRLADAKFFFDQDRKKKLADRVTGLDKVVYHRELGTQGERTRRVQAIARSIGQVLGGEALAKQADQAAGLAKADLLTDMVGEFPELQGTMGRYYAQHDGLPEYIAFAIEDHYRPRFAGDELPRNETGVVVALADKLETLVGLFGIGQLPTGDKDPFALRRHALGVIRLLVERDLPLGLQWLIDQARAAMPEHAQGDWLPPFEFVRDRATGYFVEQGFDIRAVHAVLYPLGAHLPLGQLLSIVREAGNFVASPAGQVLAQANKRITNILRKSGIEVPIGFSPRHFKLAPDPSKFQQDEEKALHAALLDAGELSLRLRDEKRFAQALAALIPLSEPVSAFFDKVLVNVDIPELRDNRIILLQHARAYMNLVADLSLMAA